jgi:hypothetical protein
MRERDYILCTNIAKVRVMRDVAFELTAGLEYGIQEEERKVLMQILHRAEERLDGLIQQSMEEEP